MNSRNSVSETNLVNFSADLSALNQFDTKDGLLSFPFDHLYACHSGTSDSRKQTLQLDKEVEISTHCVVSDDKDLINTSSEANHLSEKLNIYKNQNKQLKDLLISHLDLIQQQNDEICKREKSYQALKQENDTLKSKLNRLDRRINLQNQRHNQSIQPLVQLSNSQSTKLEHNPSQIMFNSFTELLIPDSRTYLFNDDLDKSKNYSQQQYDITNRETGPSNYVQQMKVTSILDDNLNCQNLTVIEEKRPFIKQETVKTENHSDTLYNMSGNSKPVIQKNRRRASIGGSLLRTSRTPINKSEHTETSNMFEDDKSYERNFTVNKKSKMINTYGKCGRNNNQKRPLFTGSLSDRLQLIDTTPTGEDPYQLGEADMREQSPIPKLMLQKTNHGRMKICSGDNSPEISKTIYDPSNMKNNPNRNITKIKYNQYSSYAPTYMSNNSNIRKPRKQNDIEQVNTNIKPEVSSIDWKIFSSKKNNLEASLCDFSYGENSNNLASHEFPPLDSDDFQKLFGSPLYHVDNLNQEVEHSAGDIVPKTDVSSKRGRKRALSTLCSMKAKKKPKTDELQQPFKPKTVKGKCVARGKKSPVPGLVVDKPYYTLVGDPDTSWYLGLDPDIKPEDLELSTKTFSQSTVEVPRWREKPYTSCYTLEGTENLDDKVFEKRHQKLEAEERRQLRWHMRRIREQRQVERLRQRQRDSWCSRNSSPVPHHPSVYTMWPQPQHDLRFIEITSYIPVTAFGENIPDLPKSDFFPPWVLPSKPMKRSKRCKTLH